MNPPHTHHDDYYKKQNRAKVGEDVEKLETLCTVGGNVNWENPYGEQYGGSLKN